MSDNNNNNNFEWSLIKAEEARVRQLCGTPEEGVTPSLVPREVMAKLLGKSRAWLDRRAVNGIDPSIRIGRSVRYDWRAVLAMAIRGELGA